VTDSRPGTPALAPDVAVIDMRALMVLE